MPAHSLDNIHGRLAQFMVFEVFLRGVVITLIIQHINNYYLLYRSMKAPYVIPEKKIWRTPLI